MDPLIISSKNESTWGDAEYWKSLCPELSLAEEAKTEVEAKAAAAEQEAETRKKRLIKDGYVLVDECLDESLIKKLRCGIDVLRKHNLPASFILLFDETWELARISANFLEKSSHEKNKFNYDLLAWCIDGKGQGFSPHRDRQPEDAAASFHPDSQPKFLTHWIALSDATPETSCLYVIPKKQDPGYEEGDTNEEDPLRRALPNKESFQHIRALPRKSGESLLFTHRIIHWGSARDEDSSATPRIAISFICSDPTFENSYVNPKYFTSKDTPPFRIRLLLVCAQLLIYYQRFDLPKETIKACYQYCKTNQEELDESYRKKVFVEFVKAMKEGEKDDSLAKTENSKENGEESDDEAVLEEMLNAEEGGYGEFEDDFDETGEGVIVEEEDEEEDDEEDDPNVTLFGTKRPLDSNGKEEHKDKKSKV